MRLLGLAALAGVIALCSACTVIHTSSSVNVTQGPGPVAVPRASITDWSRAEDRERPVFVGVALSGGGSRAASFSAAVLEELHRLGILQHVAAISSVSGGSLANAYYGVAKPATDEHWREMRHRMGQNFFTRWLVSFFYPQNIVRYWFTDFDRSDIMAAVFDGSLYTRRTFAALGPHGPKIFINATALSLPSKRFVFSQENFDHRLRSDLAAYPLARAVMASGAFPAAFHNVTLRNYAPQVMVAPETAAGPPPESRERWEHLFDGGPTDNLGVETLIVAAQNFYRSPARASRPRGCLFVIVDSDTGDESYRVGFQSDTRGLVDFIVDRNAVAAVNALMHNRRLDLLHRRLNFPIPTDRVHDVREYANGRIEHDVTEDRAPVRILRPLSEFDLFAGDPGATAEERAVRCTAWVLNFDRLGGGVRDESERSLLGNYAAATRDDVWAYHRKLETIARRIATHYTHTGPHFCAGPFLQQVLYDTAHILAREDASTVRTVCQWLDARGVAVPDCVPLPPRPPKLQDLVIPTDPLGEFSCPGNAAVSVGADSP
jgi:predicted acylesterase/phospholipase RssA